jgi:hypothetical protein
MPYHYWDGIFENRDTLYTYELFLQAVSLFPKFCGEFVTNGGY